ncbi:copia-type polyprotein, partial [Trifolium medium]|nr:copia-type polyprotein [Trifolium medium]
HSDSTEAQEWVPNTSSEDESQHGEDELPPRLIRLPGHLRDFVVGNEAQQDDDMQNLAFYSNCEDPDTYDEACKKQVWRDAMEAEIKAIEANNTWKLTTLPRGVKAIGVKWIFKTKYNENGQIEKHKARLVAKGY